MMQAHVRHVERLSNFMSPVGLSIQHYTGSHNRKRQRFLTGTTNLSGSSDESKTDGNNDPNKNNVPPSSPNPTTRSSVSTSTSTTTSNPHRIGNPTENQWTREGLSLKHVRNRSLFYNNAQCNDDQVNRENNQIMNAIIDKLLIYGYETSADIAKMQPWQLRVLKKEIPQIDYIFCTAYSMWGKKEYYDDYQNMSFRQFWDPAVWLQYNEIELIIKCFDGEKRGYRCMICATSHGLYELDQLRWHIWLEHKDDSQLSMEMQASKKHYNDFEMQRTPLKNLKLQGVPSNHNHNNNHSMSTTKRVTNTRKNTPVVSLLDSSDDDIDVNAQKNNRKQRKYSIRARQYTSKRRNNNNKSQSPDVSIISTTNSNSKQNGTRKRRRRNNQNNNNNNVSNQNVIQNPIIINGNNENENVPITTMYHVNDSRALNDDHAFMPSTNLMSLSPNKTVGNEVINNNNNNKTVHNSSGFSLDTINSTQMDMDDDTMTMNNMWNINNNNDNLSLNGFDDQQFSMIGFGDDFGAFGAMNRQSSGSLGNIKLSSAFADDCTSLPCLQDSFMNEMSVSDPNFSFNRKPAINQ